MTPLAVTYLAMAGTLGIMWRHTRRVERIYGRRRP